MDSSKSVDDDTIRDQMESGYVTTRPRFTRARRTWKINVRTLVAEDMRVIDEFVMVTAQRGANAFLWPNLLPNWSFEFPALSAPDLALGWALSAGVPEMAASIVSAPVADGSHALQFATVNGQSLPANSAVTATVSADQLIPCSPGDGYWATAQTYFTAGTLAAGVLSATLNAVFYSVTGTILSTQSATASLTAGWQPLGLQFTTPANAVNFAVRLSVTLTNSASSAIALDGSTALAWDCLGCALAAPLTPYGRMAGSAPLGALVRFSKLPESADQGMGQGVKRYGVNFELTEV